MLGAETPETEFAITVLDDDDASEPAELTAYGANLSHGDTDLLKPGMEGRVHSVGHEGELLR
ncbi:MAG: hypothetical protein ABI364_08520 [Caldimonas sp.]